MINLYEEKIVISVKNIRQKFGNIFVLDGISFDIYEGEHLAIVGKNGCGKTTLVEIIAGLNKPFSGKIEYFIENYQENIGIQFQESDYPQGVNVKDILKFSLGLYKSKLSAEELEELIYFFGINEFFLKNAKSLSGGQAQRLNLFLAIIHKPKIIFFDEISTGLDVYFKKKIYIFLKKFIEKNNITLIIISHDYSEIEFICKKVIVINRGKILLEDYVQNLLKIGNLRSQIEKYIF